MIPHIDLLISPWFVIRITWSLHCWIALIKYCLSYTNHHFLFVVIDKLFSKLPKGTKLLQLTVCHGCKAGKSTHKPFPGSAKTTRRILEVVHSDLAGPMQVKSIQGLLYTATFVDDYSHPGSFPSLCWRVWGMVVVCLCIFVHHMHIILNSTQPYPLNPPAAAGTTCWQSFL